MTDQTPDLTAAWIDGDPLMEAIAATLWEHCARDDEDMPQAVCDDPRTIAAWAAAVVRAVPSAVPAPAADRAGLREQIATAVDGVFEAWRDGLGDVRPQDALVDVVLAVLPASVDPAAVLREAADDCDEAGATYARNALNDHAAGAFTLMEHFLRKANEAEYVATPCSVGGCEPGGEPCSTHERLMAHAEGDHELCGPECRTTGGELRRLAVEARDGQTTQGEAHPSEHTWAAELYDPLAEEWVPGTRYSTRDRAVNHLDHARAIGPTWKDGMPTQRRLVRATTTYTVEAEHQPAAGPAGGAQQPKEARP